MKFIQIENEYGNNIMINIDNLIMIGNSNGVNPNAKLTFIGDTIVIAKEDYEAICEKIKKATT